MCACTRAPLQEFGNMLVTSKKNTIQRCEGKQICTCWSIAFLSMYLRVYLYLCKHMIHYRMGSWPRVRHSASNAQPTRFPFLPSSTFIVGTGDHRDALPLAASHSRTAFDDPPNMSEDISADAAAASITTHCLLLPSSPPSRVLLRVRPFLSKP